MQSFSESEPGPPTHNYNIVFQQNESHPVQVPLGGVILVHHAGYVMHHRLLLHCVLDICYLAQKRQVKTVA